MLKSLAALSEAADDDFINCADRPMLMSMKKFDFEYYFGSCLNVCVIDGVWLSLFGGTPEHPSFTLIESIRSYNNRGSYWEKVVSENSFTSWTKVYTEFKHRVVFLEKFYKANGINRRRICVGF